MEYYVMASLLLVVLLLNGWENFDITLNHLSCEISNFSTHVEVIYRSDRKLITT